MSEAISAEWCSRHLADSSEPERNGEWKKGQIYLLNQPGTRRKAERDCGSAGGWLLIGGSPNGIRPTALKLHVVGHSDDKGTLTYNLDLSKRRAQELVSFHGISASRLVANGIGPLAPVASNENEDGRAKNRRVELVEFIERR